MLICRKKGENMQGLDIETAKREGGGALDPAEGRIRLVQIADAGECKIIDADHVDPRPYIEALSDPIAHNADFERKWIAHHLGIDLGAIHDTKIMSQVLYTGTPHGRNVHHHLKDLARRVLDAEMDKEMQVSDWNTPELSERQLRYAAEDAIILLPIAESLLERLEAEGLREVYELERRCAPAIAEMEANGIAVDRGRLDEFIETTGARAAELKAELEAEWGINPGSTKQLREYFRLDEREDWPITPKGAPKTDQSAMKALIPEDASVEKWVEWKKVEKLRSTYGTTLAKKIDPDGRIRARFNPFGTATGRFSSSNPNMQNIPKDSDIRSMFVSGSPDRVLITADYKSMEIWIAAVLWRDGKLMQILRDGTSFHKATAAAIYGKPISEITEDEKAVAKTANFALQYNASAETVYRGLKSKGLNTTEAEAEKIHRTFFQTYRGVGKKRSAARTGWDEGTYREARTPLGRRRSDASWYGHLTNHEIQGTGADAVKLALAKLHEDGARFPTAKLVATVHDEIIVEADKGEANAVAEWVEDHMVEALREAVAPVVKTLPIEPGVDITIAPAWAKGE